MRDLINYQFIGVPAEWAGPCISALSCGGYHQNVSNDLFERRHRPHQLGSRVAICHSNYLPSATNTGKLEIPSTRPDQSFVTLLYSLSMNH